MRIVMRGDVSLEDKFKARILPPDENGCWNWYKHNSRGYPNMHDGLKPIAAHRFSFEFHCGPIPKGMVVMHRCDNKRCVNPDHLMVGTHAQNVADMIEKGRKVQVRGVRIAKAKLNPEKAAEIKTLLAEGRLLKKEIAARFGIHPTTVWFIEQGRTWR